MDARLIRLSEVMNPVVESTKDLKDGFCKQAVIMKLQEAVFWYEKAINDETKDDQTPKA